MKQALAISACLVTLLSAILPYFAHAGGKEGGGGDLTIRRILLARLFSMDIIKKDESLSGSERGRILDVLKRSPRFSSSALGYGRVVAAPDIDLRQVAFNLEFAREQADLVQVTRLFIQFAAEAARVNASSSQEFAHRSVDTELNREDSAFLPVMVARGMERLVRLKTRGHGIHENYIRLAQAYAIAIASRSPRLNRGDRSKMIRVLEKDPVIVPSDVQGFGFATNVAAAAYFSHEGVVKFSPIRLGKQGNSLIELIALYLHEAAYSIGRSTSMGWQFDDFRTELGYRLVKEELERRDSLFSTQAPALEFQRTAMQKIGVTVEPSKGEGLPDWESVKGEMNGVCAKIVAGCMTNSRGERVLRVNTSTGHADSLPYPDAKACEGEAQRLSRVGTRTKGRVALACGDRSAPFGGRGFLDIWCDGTITKNSPLHIPKNPPSERTHKLGSCVDGIERATDYWRSRDQRQSLNEAHQDLLLRDLTLEDAMIGLH